MSRASIEQALTGLVPTLNGPLPPELVDIALSLLARSRSVAHSLKPDEEIGRPYACAQLACERLKKRLNLPSITSRPPCPPRVYKKLYNYLASALPAASAQRSEPQTPRKNTSAPNSARTTPRTPTTARRTPQTALRTNNSTAAEPPAWVMPAIRVLAKKFEYAAVAPHVFTGVESLIPLLTLLSSGPGTPSARARRPTTALPALSQTKLYALIVAVFQYVLARIMNTDITPEQYEERLNLAVDTLRSVAEAASVGREELMREAEELMAVAQQEGWLEMEWFLNVVPWDEAEEMEGVEMAVPGPGIGLRRRKFDGSAYVGLGTMLQDATDYLSEQRREEYKAWRAGIMARCEELEAGA
ncbi:hypothetical protein E8E13_002469 [Curvularia kusanoi]|uniref:ORC6 first cyclin-like domain-containing protein n=1 Tax=Curvularia kusanoi TaxID=90978 RepID=A0A9P4W8G8_CURKU|nr:hypothetical protein E8E13_002469 [Curvularia kusanoi]